jgi:predicted methyltransferase
MAELILSHFQAGPLLQARKEGHAHTNVSPDLGLTSVEVILNFEGAVFPKNEVVDWTIIEEVARSETGCFRIVAGEIEKVTAFSEYTNRVYSLYPTSSAPTMLISGLPMHRIKGTNPYKDTLEKVRAIKPLVGKVLDTATGLGYTAIQASYSAEKVVTIELDPIVLEIARLNPWSQGLFIDPKIDQRIGDSFDVIEDMDDETFTCIVHDPPVFSLAGHLYSTDFYRELYRVLRHKGRLFHYIGNPKSKSGGNMTRGVIERMKKAGFERVKRVERAFGVVASK